MKVDRNGGIWYWRWWMYGWYMVWCFL